MAQKRSRSLKVGSRAAEPKTQSRNPRRNQMVALAPSPLVPQRQAVMVKDLLGSFSEQTGASFG